MAIRPHGLVRDVVASPSAFSGKDFWWAALYVRVRMHVLLSWAKVLSVQANRNPQP